MVPYLTSRLLPSVAGSGLCACCNPCVPMSFAPARQSSPVPPGFESDRAASVRPMSGSPFGMTHMLKLAAVKARLPLLNEVVGIGMAGTGTLSASPSPKTPLALSSTGSSNQTATAFGVSPIKTFNFEEAFQAMTATGSGSFAVTALRATRSPLAPGATSGAPTTPSSTKVMTMADRISRQSVVKVAEPVLTASRRRSVSATMKPVKCRPASAPYTRSSAGLAGNVTPVVAPASPTADSSAPAQSVRDKFVRVGRSPRWSIGAFGGGLWVR